MSRVKTLQWDTLVTRQVALSQRFWALAPLIEQASWGLYIWSRILTIVPLMVSWPFKGFSLDKTLLYVECQNAAAAVEHLSSLVLRPIVCYRILTSSEPCWGVTMTYFRQSLRSSRRNWKSEKQGHAESARLRKAWRNFTEEEVGEHTAASLAKIFTVGGGSLERSQDQMRTAKAR